MPAWDPATPYPPVLMGMFTHPTCADPLWSPTREEDLVRQNAAAMEKLNVIGVVSGADDRIAALRALVPQRVIPGMGIFLVKFETDSPDIAVASLGDSSALRVGDWAIAIASRAFRSGSKETGTRMFLYMNDTP